MSSPTTAADFANKAMGWLVETHPWANATYADVVIAMEAYARQCVEAVREAGLAYQRAFDSGDLVVSMRANRFDLGERLAAARRALEP